MYFCNTLCSISCFFMNLSFLYFRLQKTLIYSCIKYITRILFEKNDIALVTLKLNCLKNRIFTMVLKLLINFLPISNRIKDSRNINLFKRDFRSFWDKTVFSSLNDGQGWAFIKMVTVFVAIEIFHLCLFNNVCHFPKNEYCTVQINSFFPSSSVYRSCYSSAMTALGPPFRVRQCIGLLYYTKRCQSGIETLPVFARQSSNNSLPLLT